MKITHTINHSDHIITVEDTVGFGKSQCTIVFFGKGDDKHATVAAALKSVEELEARLKSYKASLSAL